jgi:hypothetical protein
MHAILRRIKVGKRRCQPVDEDAHDFPVQQRIVNGARAAGPWRVSQPGPLKGMLKMGDSKPLPLGGA